jgi:hypothetical protein
MTPKNEDLVAAMLCDQTSGLTEEARLDRRTPLLVLPTLAPLPLLRRWRAASQSTWTLKDGSQSSFRQRTASGTRKLLTPERLWHQKSAGTRKALVLHLGWCYHIC